MSEKEDLDLWFGMSRASWLTLPRVLMQEMPEDWKKKMSLLLNEFDDAYPNQPDFGTRVQLTINGKLTKTPGWLLNYRRPDRAMINSLRTEGKPTD